MSGRSFHLNDHRNEFLPRNHVHMTYPSRPIHYRCYSPGITTSGKKQIFICCPRKQTKFRFQLFKIVGAFLSHVYLGYLKTTSDTDRSPTARLLGDIAAIRLLSDGYILRRWVQARPARLYRASTRPALPAGSAEEFVGRRRASSRASTSYIFLPTIRFARVDPIADAVDACGEVGGDGQVGVMRGGNGAVFKAPGAGQRSICVRLLSP